MARIETNQIRNICFLGHGGSGKTTLAEAMLYLGKATDRFGSVNDGNTVCDYDAEEVKRKFSISLATANLMWKDCKINILDAPGFLDFSGEVMAGLRVADAAVIAVDAKSGIQVGTELAWENASAAGLPKAFFINRCDDSDAKFHEVFSSLVEKFGTTLCPVLIPAKTAASFINLIDLKKYVYNPDGSHTEGDIMPEYMPTVEKYREKLFEAIATTSDALMEKFFGGQTISRDEAVMAIHEGIISGDITPVFSGSATKLWGVDLALDNIADSFPRHTAKKKERLSDGSQFEIKKEGAPYAFVFKTAIDQFGRTSYFKVMSGVLTAGATLKNTRTGIAEKFAHFYTMRGKKQTEADTLCAGDIGAIVKLVDTNTNDTLSAVGDAVAFAPVAFPEPFLSMAIAPKIKGEEDKVAQGIIRLSDEDKTLRFESNPETHQMLISAIGDMQIDIAVSRLKARGSVQVELSAPRIAYRETIRKKVQCEGKHKKQSGGHGQYGHVKMTFAPGEADGLTFTTSVVGGSVPKGYFPAVEKGLQESMVRGVLAGYPVVNLAADLYDGSYHDVDSNELSFKMAASLAYKAGLPLAGPVLLEPVGAVAITVPEDKTGDVLGDVNGRRRGSVLGMNPTPNKKGYTTIDAEMPRSEMSDYSTALRAMTQGKGSFTYRHARYDEVPSNLVPKITAEAKSFFETEE